MNKKCGKCNTIKPLSGFSKNKSKNDGYNNWCSVCHYSYIKEKGYLKQNQINDKHKTGCGIYKIIIKPTQEVYIGKGYLTPRFRTHKYNLINNKHENPNLQRQFNKYYQNNMEDILDFIILEKCEEYELKYKELYYMTKEFMENKDNLLNGNIPLPSDYTPRMKRLSEEEKSKKKGILELYTCIQTEGSKAGYPNILVRFSGCTHRCYFGEGGFCDSWYTSWSPEKAIYSINDVEEFIKKHNYISHMMITGGSPTMYPEHVNELIHLMHKHHGENCHITMETEGSHYIETDFKIDLISLSPKFSNSLPVVGTVTPNGKVVTEKMIEQHNKFRMLTGVMQDLIKFHKDYHYKPVWSPGDEKTFEEIENFRVEMNIPKSKTWLMPGGDTREELIKVYPAVINKCVEVGYNFTGRDHIIAFNDQRGV